MRRLILRSHQSPGDVLMLTAAVRDLHAAHPRQFLTDVRTSAPDLWLHNPHLTPLSDTDPTVETLDMHYPLVHQANQRPYHFLHGYAQYLEERLQVRIPVTQFRGDIHLGPDERAPLPLEGISLPERYWIVMAGGKYDFTAKWWNPASYQQVVDHFRGTIHFLQCGEAGHWHPPLTGVTNLVGRTSIRQFVRLMYRAEGVVCPVTFAMHLAAAVPVRPQSPPTRACIVLAGGREPPHWEAYPTHQFLHTVGALDCCRDGGCWKSRCQLVGDGDAKDRRELCEQPVQVAPDLRIPRCLDLITPVDVIRRIEWYLTEAQHVTQQSAGSGVADADRVAPASLSVSKTPDPATAEESLDVLFELDGDLTTVVEFSTVLHHLQHYQPECPVSVIVRPGQAGLLQGLCQTVYEAGRTPAPLGPRRHVKLSPPAKSYPRWASTGATRFVFEELHLTPVPSLCSDRVTVTPSADASGQELLRQLTGSEVPDNERLPLVVLNLTDDSATTTTANRADDFRAIADAVCRSGRRTVRLDWRSAEWIWTGLLPNNDVSERRVAVTDADVLAAMLRRVQLIVGPASGPVRLASAVSTPAIVVWPQIPDCLDFAPATHATHLLPSGRNGNGALHSLTQSRRLGYRIAEWRDLPSDLASQVATELGSPSPALSGMSVPTQAPSAVRHPPSLPSSRQEPSVRHTVRFVHGLGDCANFAKLIPLYARRGLRIGVECTADKEIVFRAAGAEIVAKADYEHAWFYPPHDVHVGHGRDHQGSKIGWNISEPPLPNIGDKAALWSEYCASEIRVSPLIPAADQDFVARWLQGLPRPILLLHTKGNTGQQAKSLPDPTVNALYRELIDRCDGTLILLDWDNRVPRLEHYRVRHLSEMGEFCTTERLFSLFDQADLFVGIDSGPLHAASLSDIPRVGIWMPTHYPSRYALPHPKQLNLVLAGPTGTKNRFRRVPWNLVEQPGHDFDAAWLADQVLRMLQPPRYLPDDQQAADVQLQQWIGRWCRGPSGPVAQGSYADRHRSFDALFREAGRRFARPMIVETGTIRAEEDWGGAGFFTYLAGAYAQRTGGKLHSVDLTPQHCDFARVWTRVFGDTVTVHCQDSLAFLREFSQPIDVLYLDSLDTYEPGHAEHALQEAQAALPRLHDQSLILFDDTPSTGGQFNGKGALAVPWLLDQGWQLLYAGYQVLLQRSPS